MLKTTRPAAVAGMFYPADPLELQEQVDQYLFEDTYLSTRVPKAIIVPHAGYIYSGSTAAAAYRSIMQFRHVIRKIILLGPAHRVPVSGLALPRVDQFQTPMGEIKLDTKATYKLVDDFPQITFSDQAHADEHSLEVQLPFLQSVLAGFRLIPLLVGDASEIEVADVIESLWGGDECLIVISSDLSHFHDYKKANRLDAQTAEAIESFKGEELQDHSACGRTPISGMLRVARQHKLNVERFDLKNSGDTAGEKDQVVGYGSWGFFQT